MRTVGAVQELAEMRCFLGRHSYCRWEVMTHKNSLQSHNILWLYRTVHHSHTPPV